MARIPAREWRAASQRRDVHAICARLGIDPAQLRDTWYALLPFAIIETDDGPLLAGVDEPELPLTESMHPLFWYQLPNGRVVSDEDLAAANDPSLIIGGNVRFAPPHLIPPDATSGPSDAATVLTLSADNRAGVHRDRRKHHLYLPRRSPEEHIAVFTDGRTFFRAWIAARVRWLHEARAARRDYGIERPERLDACIPGALLIGDARKVAWPQDRHFICADEETARAVNAGILRSARLSSVSVAAPHLRKAA